MSFSSKRKNKPKSTINESPNYAYKNSKQHSMDFSVNQFSSGFGYQTRKIRY